MKEIRWSKEKDARLKMNRGIGFEQVAEMIERNEIIEVILHPNTVRYPNQGIYALLIGGYVYHVPCVETNIIFLKTIFPSRKATKHYLRDH
ncbi:MAG: toxin [Elusimicrobia bacterium]|nr:toxin [Elusimicrobiota bacterium]